MYTDFLGIKTSEAEFFPFDTRDGSRQITGLLNLSPEYYKTRCQLDSIKFTKIAETEQGFNGNFIAELDEVPEILVDASDSLTDTGYSYLTPSIVEYSDPSEENVAFSYRYDSFGPQALQFVLNPFGYNLNALLSWQPTGFYDITKYDNILISLYNHYLNNEYGNADSTAAHLSIDSFFDSNPAILEFFEDNGVTKQNIKEREIYKDVFDSTGLTLHSSVFHDEFFDKEPGPSVPNLNTD